MGKARLDGPWGWQDFGAGPVLVAAHGRRSIVVCASRGGKLESCGDDGILQPLDTSGAAARMIAAAPLLQEALQSVVVDLECYSREERIPGACAQASLDKARAALAAAK